MATELPSWPDYCRTVAQQLAAIADQLEGEFREQLNPMQELGRDLAVNNISTAIKMLGTAATARWTAEDEARWARAPDDAGPPPAIINLDDL